MKWKEFMTKPHRCKIPPSAARLSQDLATLVNNRQGSDIQFIVGGSNSIHRENGETITNEPETVTLYAHSIILRCRSRYFAAMLDEDRHWKEGSNGVIYKPNISPGIFKDILHYIYTGNCVKNSENIIDLIIAADEMDLDELSAECQTELIHIVESVFSEQNDNRDDGEDRGTLEEVTRHRIPIDVAVHTHIIPALNFASTYSLSDLSQRLQAAILPHISVIIDSPDAYTAFIYEISSEALFKIITSDNLAMTERSIWDLALSWGCHQIGLSKTAVEAQLNTSEDQDGDGSSGGTVNMISVAQLDQLKTRMEPLLPAIRFSLLDSDDYHQILGTINYLLPHDQLFGLSQFFSKPINTVPLDIPREERVELKISSTITIKSFAWDLLRKNIFETGGINGCLSFKHLKFELLFRASEHAYIAKSFHQNCDNKGPTLVLVRSASGHIFGGVNFNHWKSGYWESDITFSSSRLNFLFALPDGSHRKHPAIFKVDPTKIEYSAVNNAYWGPLFGGGRGSDLVISDSAHTRKSYSQLPICYNGDGASKIALAGTEYFKVSEYEVFAISS